MENAVFTSKLVRDAKRDADHKHKWQLGDWSAVAGGKQRPWHLPHKRSRLKLTREHPQTNRTNADPHIGIGSSNRKRPATVLDNEILSISHDHKLGPYSTSTSSSESIQHGSRAPEPDAGIAYSYDASKGPGDGTDILGHAVNKAVARFEDQKTTRLVNDEYDVVKDAEDGDAEAEMVEDFELIGKFEM